MNDESLFCHVSSWRHRHRYMSMRDVFTIKKINKINRKNLTEWSQPRVIMGNQLIVTTTLQ